MPKYPVQAWIHVLFLKLLKLCLWLWRSFLFFNASFTADQIFFLLYIQKYFLKWLRTCPQLGECCLLLNYQRKIIIYYQLNEAVKRHRDDLCVNMVLMQYIKHERHRFIEIFKPDRVESWKYDAQWKIFDETLSRVVDISSQWKQKLRNKRGCQIVNFYDN